MSQKSDRLAAARAALEAAEADGPEDLTPAHVVDGVVVDSDPPTGVRSPATLEIDLNARKGVDVAPGTPVPPLVDASLPSERAPHAVVARRGHSVPSSVETRGPLVDLEHPSTIEAAVVLQHIPNDSIHAVFEDAAGVKRDALGHIFDPTPRIVPRTTGKGFE